MGRSLTRALREPCSRKKTFRRAVDAIEPPSIRRGVKEQGIRLHLGQRTTMQPKVDITLNDAGSVLRCGEEFLIESQRGLVLQPGTLPAQVEPDAGDVQPQPLATIRRGCGQGRERSHEGVASPPGRAVRWPGPLASIPSRSTRLYSPRRKC